MEEMKNSTSDFTVLKESTNSTIQTFSIIDYLEIGVYCINILFSFPIHVYILRLIVSGNGIASEFLNLNLCFCEIGICMDNVFFILSQWFPSFTPLDLFLFGLSATGRPLFQCLMCVERYLAVVHPVTFLKYKPLRYRLSSCIPAWTISLCFCYVSLHYLSFKKYKEHALLSSVELLSIISIQLFCLVAVLKALKQSGPGDGKKEEENQMKKRAFNLILITTVNMIVLYFPFAMTTVSIIVTGENSTMVWFTSLTCFVLGGFVQPFLFLRRAGKLPNFCSR